MRQKLTAEITARSRLARFVVMLVPRLLRHS